MRLIMAVVIPVAFATFFLTSLASAQTNALYEANFDSDQARPPGWNQGAAIPSVEYLFETKGVNNSKAIGIKKDANRYFPIAQWSTVVKHDGKMPGLEVQCQIKAKRVTKSKLDVAFVDKNGKLQSHEWVISIGSSDQPADHDWKAYSGKVAIPDGTKSFAVSLQTYGPGEIWLDDLAIKYTKEAPETAAKEEGPALETKKVTIGRADGEYLTVAARGEAPKDGYGLLVVLPGGDGSADFHPFVKNIHANAIGDDFVLVQPVAKKWTDEQVVVWPTSKLKVKRMKFTTEQLIEAVIEDISSQTKIDPNRVIGLGWSSSGQAIYASLLKKNAKMAKGFVAMSVYKPDLLPNLKHAKGKRVFLLHSKGDKICPFWMAEKANEELGEAGLETKLVEYEGGHGWRGNVFQNLKDGFNWLER